jgi:tetratricopeptide (TPR) repeat protein
MMNLALERQRGQPDLHHLRGLAYRAMGQNARAIEDLKIAIAGRPRDGRAYYNRGAAYRAIGEYNKAISDENQAIQLAPDDPSRDLFYQERGVALEKLGLARKDRSLVSRALADFNEVIKLKPNNGWAWHQRGSVWLALEEPVKALADFDRAEASLAPADRYWLYQDRANVKQLLGDYQGASADRQRAALVTEKR